MFLKILFISSCAGVVCRVLSVDKAAGRLNLGLKPSYFEGLSDVEASDEDQEAVGADFDEELEAAMSGSEDDVDEAEEEGEEGSSEEEEEESDEDEDGADFDLDEELLEAEAEEGGLDGSESEEEDQEESD